MLGTNSTKQEQKADFSAIDHNVAPSIQAENTKKTRIAIVTETWYPDINGVSRSIGKLVESLLNHGFDIQLFHAHSTISGTDLRIEEHAMRGFALPFYKEVKVGLPQTKRFIKLWQEQPPKCVQIVTEGPLGYSALRAAKKLGIPVISDYHTNFQQYAKSYKLGLLTQWVQRYLRHVHNKTELTLIPTEELKQTLNEQGFKNVGILARGIDTQHFNPRFRSQSLRQQWGLSNDELAVIYVGRIAAEKNIDLAVRTFKAIQKDQPSTRFILVGDGPIRSRLETQHPEFIFCGMQTGEALATHYASADLFLAPSITETFGNIILEAMASQLAVVTYDYAAGHEHIKSSQNGMSAPLHDEAAFIKAAQLLACDETLRLELAKRAYNTAQNLGWARICHEFESLLLQITQPELLQGEVS